MSILIYITLFEITLVGEFGDHFEGDMILTKDQLDNILSPIRNGLIAKNYRWPNKIVPFALSPDHTESQNRMIEDALKKIEAVSCIKFVRRTNQNDYVQIIVSFQLCYKC